MSGCWRCKRSGGFVANCDAFRSRSGTGTTRTRVWWTLVSMVWFGEAKRLGSRG